MFNRMKAALGVLSLMTFPEVGCNDTGILDSSGVGSGGSTNPGETTQRGGSASSGGSTNITCQDTPLVSDSTQPHPLLIADFDTDLTGNTLGGVWATWDNDVPTTMVWPLTFYRGGWFEPSEPGFGDHGKAARLIGVLAQNNSGYGSVSIGITLGPDTLCPLSLPTTVNLPSYSGIRFRSKGILAGGNLTMSLPHLKSGQDDNCEDGDTTGKPLTDWNAFSVDLTKAITPDWSTVSVDFRCHLKVPKDFTLKEVLEHAKIIVFDYVNPSNGGVDLWLDNVEFY
jgi:hypothetical protein